MSENIIQLNEAAIKGELRDLVKNSVEETLNALLDHEADELVNAERYERSGDRKGYRSGHYDRNFTTTSGDVTLHVPKLKGIQFENDESDDSHTAHNICVGAEYGAEYQF